jgi:hypothetical protein
MIISVTIQFEQGAEAVSPPLIGTGVRLVFWDALVAVIMDIPPAKRALVFSLLTHDDWWRR